MLTFCFSFVKLPCIPSKVGQIIAIKWIFIADAVLESNEINFSSSTIIEFSLPWTVIIIIIIFT